MNTGIVFDRYGSLANLSLGDLPRPAAEKDKAVVRIHAIGLNPRDLSILAGKFKWLTGRRFPKLTGADFAGEIAELPPGESRWRVGDQVMGYFDALRGGVSARYCQISLSYLIPRPGAISATQAAAIGCTYLTAYQALVVKGDVQPGQKVLIYGAAGGVGTAAIQLAKQRGAIVTAVSHSRNAAYCRQQGANCFVAYDRTDVFALPQEFDLFLQVYSEQGDLYARGKKVVKSSGRYITLIPNPLRAFVGQFQRPRAGFVLAKSDPDHWAHIVEGVKTGALVPHVDHVYPLADYAAAFQQLEAGKVQGKIVIDFSPG